MRTRLLILGTLLLALGSGIAPVDAQERFGSIVGTISDTTGAPIPGATITITNSDTEAFRVFVSGANGVYRANDIVPGRYSVAVELGGFQRVVGDDVIVLLGRTVDFSVALRIGALTETVNVTGEATKIVDLTSVTVAHNVTQEEFDRLPKARSFQGIALVAPGVNSGEIEGGIQVNGASGAENAYTVDGVVTNSLVNGASRQDTVFEYLQEVQVKTGGIDAEFGGALGGVISAVTKSGGNSYRGELHYYYDGNALAAAPVERLVLNPADDTTIRYFQDEKQKNNRNEFGGSLGGPIVRDKLFFFASVSPRLVRRTNDYLFSEGTEPGSIDRSDDVWQTFGKVTYSSSRMVANGSVLYTPTSSTGVLPAYRGFGSNFLASSEAGNAANRDRGWEINQTNVSGNVDVTLSPSSYLSARGGYFYDDFKDVGIPDITSVQWSTPSIGVPGVPADLQQPTGFQNTPRALITDFDTTKRGFFQVDYNQALDSGSAGSHLIKGGVGYQRTVNDVQSLYPGGYVRLFWDRSFRSNVTGETNRGTYGYYEVNDRGVLGSAGANIISLYVQDQWQVNSRLTLNIGVRSENETIPSFQTDLKENAFQFGFGDKIAPRLGATYDVLGDGRVKLYGSWGRYYDWTKYELSRGAFGADKWQIYYRGLDTLDVNSLSLDNKPGADLWGSASGFRDRRVPNFETVDPDIKPMSQDSTNVGVEYEVNPTTVLGVHYVHNTLNRTIEDVGVLVNGDEQYFYANPGDGLAKTSFTTGLTEEFPIPKAMRKYDAFELTLNRRFSNNYFFNASYTYSRLYGNYAGLASSDEIRTPTTNVTSATAQQQSGSIARPGSNVTRGWDLDELLWDSNGNLDVVGRLATDRPHVVKLYGAYQFPFGTQIGANFYGGSGTPITTYVNTVNQIPAMVFGRGDLGRTPMLTRTDLLLSHELDLMNSRRIRLELNVVNLFNQKTARHIFNYLNKGAGVPRQDSAISLGNVDLAQGYDPRALINDTPSGADAFDPRYGQDDLFNDGIQGQFSVKFIF